MTFALMMLGGLLLDAAFGWPDRLFARIGHPVTWLGHLISAFERRLNNGSRQNRLLSGTLTAGLLVSAAAFPVWAVQTVLPAGWVGIALGSIVAWPLIALRSMHDHVVAVENPLRAGDIDTARRAVSMIVGRETSTLDAAAVTRAATESLAENTSDGIVAPLFWGALLGLPGIYAYKAINTMDSMIGHRNDRYEAFGKAAARLDDVVNWIPARLTGLAFALASGRMAHTLRVMARDARHHRSPNAGWPEGAMAGALDIRLSGPRTYGNQITQDPWVNGACPDPVPSDLGRALSLFRRAMALCGLALAAAALL